MVSFYYDMYQTKEQLKENKKAKRNALVIILFVVCITTVIIGVELLLMGYLKNHHRISSEYELTEESKENDDNREKKIESAIAKETEETSELVFVSETGAISQTFTADVKSEQESSAATTSIVSSRAVVVVRDGYLNGVAQGYTVGNILDIYSGGSGTWSSENTTDGNSTIIYSAYKDGSAFSVIFTVYPDDTFTLVGATKNNVEVGKYTEFFQNILNEVGF
jgi:flagellar basal body-associated protein FliL